MTDDGPYHVRRELKPGTTWLVTDDTPRRLVLKRLPEDCLRQGRLHPAVRDRLARFRELPLVTFAALIGVERWGEHVVTVSEFVDGVPLDAVPTQDRARHYKAIRHSIAALHQLGLVHGQLHGANVLIDSAGAVRVIDPSPLLHDDPADDLAALDRLDPREAVAATAAADEDAPIRRRTLATAIVVAAAGIIAAVALVAIFWRSA